MLKLPHELSPGFTKRHNYSETIPDLDIDTNSNNPVRFAFFYTSITE